MSLQAQVDQLLEDHDAGDVLGAMKITLEAQADDAAAAGDGASAEGYEADLEAVQAALDKLGAEG